MNEKKEARLVVNVTPKGGVTGVSPEAAVRAIQAVWKVWPYVEVRVRKEKLLVAVVAGELTISKYLERRTAIRAAVADAIRAEPNGPVGVGG